MFHHSPKGYRIGLGIVLTSTVAMIARGSDGHRPPDKDPQAPLSPKRTICHRSHQGIYSQRTVSASSFENHIQHGDCLVEDGFACTIDSCDRVRGCVHTPDHARCNDGLFCTTDTCDPRNGCVTVGACRTFVDGCIRRNECDEDNNACVDRPDDQLCDDGQFCTTETCNADTGACVVSDTCPAFNDLANCLTYGRCDEAAQACPADPLIPCCGDGTCDPGEDTSTCPNDCTCPNGNCDAGEDATNCPQDCGCGNGICDPGEDASCPDDCGT